MIIECDKCQSKFKIDDSKVTDRGVKVKCRKCSNIFTVFPPQAEEQPISLFQETLEVKETKPKEEISFDLPSSEFTFSENKEEKKEIKEDQKEEFSWDQFNIDIAIKQEEPQQKESETIGDFKFDFEEFKEEKEEIKEEPKEEKTEDFELSFDFDKLASEEKKPDEEDKKEVSIEDYIKEESPSKGSFDFDFSFEEKKEEEVAKEPEKEEETFSFDNLSFDEEKKEKKPEEEEKFLGDFNLEEPKKDESVFESFQFKEEPPKEPLEETKDLDFTFAMEEPSMEKIDLAEDVKSDKMAQEKNELNFSFLEEEEKTYSFPQDEYVKKDTEPTAQVPPLEYEEVKPKSNILTIVVSLLIVILFSGTGIGFVWWQKMKTLEKEGSFGFSEVKVEIVESKTLGNVFVVKGKITNGYRVPKSFLKVKCLLLSKDNKKLAEKVAFASNIFTKDEIRELTYPDIEKGLNNKMGKSMMNVDVPPGKAIPFMVVFDKIPEGVSHIEVESIL